MNVQDLAPFVIALLLVGMIAGVGVLTIDKFSVATKTTTSVSNETITFTDGAGTTANDEVLAITSAALCNTTAATVTISNAYTGALAIAAPYNEGEFDGCVYYTYSADSQTSLVLDSGRDAVGSISEDWMGLIVVIGILALVLGLTIAGFSHFGKRR